jgi:hypothetical protein
MKIQFNILCTLSISHEYYEGTCPDFDIVIPDSTVRLLSNGKMIAKTLEGTLNILFEADDMGTPVKNMSGSILRFGLKLNNPYFTNYTKMSFDPSKFARIMNNNAAVGTLAAADIVSLCGNLVPHLVTQVTRPVDLSIYNREGNQVGKTITIADTRPSADFDITGQEAGPYDVLEDYSGGSTQTIHYYVDPLLNSAGTMIIVEIKIDNSFYTSPAGFAISFTAQSDVLNYYVVASRYTDPEAALLNIVDTGFTDDPRPQINFNKIASSSFTAAELAPALYSAGGDKVFLFRSTSSIKKRQRSRKKLQLMKNGTAIIENLANPTIDKPTTNLIIKISKP